MDVKPPDADRLGLVGEVKPPDGVKPPDEVKPVDGVKPPSCPTTGDILSSKGVGVDISREGVVPVVSRVGMTVLIVLIVLNKFLIKKFQYS